MEEIACVRALSETTTDTGQLSMQADLLSQFRTEVLELPSLYSQNGVLRSRSIHKVPFTYCFSPTLVARPSDWPEDLVDVAGFFFLDEGSSKYEPPKELVDFLAAKEKPVYFGFGSLVVPNPQVRNHRCCALVLSAVRCPGKYMSCNAPEGAKLNSSV